MKCKGYIVIICLGVEICSRNIYDVLFGVCIIGNVLWSDIYGIFVIVNDMEECFGRVKIFL